MLDFRASLLCTSLLLVGCGGTSAEPSGQVVATVDGDEITTTDLNAELAGAAAPTPEAQKQLQRMALENIINRKIMAQASVDEGLDDGPNAAVLEKKAKELALIELLNQKLRSSVPKPSADEIASYVESNPAQFAERRIFVVDQIIVPRADQALLKALQPAKSLAEAQQVLTAAKAQTSRALGVVDALTIPAEAARQIAALPPGEVFIIPAQGGLRINTVKSSQLTPISGPQAQTIASEMLVRTRTEGAMRTELQKRMAAGREAVKYNATFAPPKAPAAGGAPAGAGSKTGA